MPDQNPLELTAASFTAQLLTIKIKNISGVSLEKNLGIEFYAPTYLVDGRIKQAAIDAATSSEPQGAKTLAGIVSCPQGWSVWAKAEPIPSVLVIALFNDVDQGTGKDLPAPTKLAPGAEFSVQIPLDPRAGRDHIKFTYSYQHGSVEEGGRRVDGELELKSTDPDWAPDVTLTTNQASPTAITPGTLARIIWRIKDGVSATLRGPLQGGNSELTLSPDPRADFKISEGFIEVRVGGSMTYLLQAEVQRPGKPNIQVVRMLSLDTLSRKYTYLSARPTKVLPHGLIEIDWAAWGVEQVMLSVGNQASRVVRLTQQTLGRSYEGSGVMRVTAGGNTASEVCRIDAPSGDQGSQTVSVISWVHMDKSDFTGQPLGAAVIAPRLMVLTTDGLFVADVGEADPISALTKLMFRKIDTPDPARWHALSAVGGRFVALRRTGQNDLEIAPFRADGSADEIPPLNLPADLRPLVARSETVFELVGFGDRAYVIVEATLTGGTIRRAFSVGFNAATKRAEHRPEQLLESVPVSKLVTFDNALYALRRDSGLMLRCRFSSSGAIESLTHAAAAVTSRDGVRESMIREGLFVPVGRVLAVLNPSAVPTLAELEPFGLRNTLSYLVRSAPPLGPNDTPQDLVHNPQKNYWGRCGHGLNIQTGAVAAFRGGSSPRLWVIQPDRETYTLAVGAESLFSHDYVWELPTKTLPPYFNRKRQLTITNSSGMQLRRVTDTYRNQGLTDFSANSPAQLTVPPPDTFDVGATRTFEFNCNEADLTSAQLRFMVEKAQGVRHDYLVEVTFSGPNLTTATSVFKRLALDAQGTLSIADIPGTAAQHSNTNPVVLSPPQRLTQGVKLRAQNFTTYQLWRRTPGGTDEQATGWPADDITITYNTPAFFIFAHGAGELHVNVDLSLPLGLEISSGREPQSKVIRINTDASTGLHPVPLANRAETSYDCKITYLRKRELDAVYVGDGVAAERGEAIYLPVALPGNQSQAQVLKVDPLELNTSASGTFTSTGMYSTPNSVALSNEYVLAMFGDTDIHVLDYSLQVQGKADFGHSFTLATQIKCHYEAILYLLGMKQDKKNPNINYHYLLGMKFINKNTAGGAQRIVYGDVSETLLDGVPGFGQTRLPLYPAWVSPSNPSPMAVSPPPAPPQRGRQLAVCIDGGMFVVGSDQQPRALKLDGTGREEDIMFGRDARTIYCLHSQTGSRALRLSRIDNQTTPTVKQTLNLPVGEEPSDLTSGPRSIPGVPYKNHRSISMVRTPDERYLFVSHGRTIFRIDAAAMTVRETYTTELPCRVFHVWQGLPTTNVHPRFGGPRPCILLYAIGARYIGDGKTRARDFKTQLYKFGIRE